MIWEEHVCLINCGTACDHNCQPDTKGRADNLDQGLSKIMLLLLILHNDNR